MGTFNFNLPDLGEGLPDAEIVNWHVKVADKVKVDQLLVSVETAKAIIDIPSPVNGTIEKLCAKVKETVTTGELLVVFATNTNEHKLPLENAKILAVPAVRNLAKKLQVDLNKIIPTGKFNTITLQDVETAALTQEHSQEFKDNLNFDNNNVNNDWVNLPNTIKSMAIAMQKSHQEVVPATIFEDAILNIKKPSDIKLNLNVKLIQAIAFAISKEPILNSWIMKEHDNFKQKIIKEINLGIAVDSPDGLFVPVIKNIANLDPTQIRTTLDLLITKIKNRTILPTELQSATFILSNFGKFAGRYATPIIIPPTVGILAVGKLRETMIVNNGTANIAYILPLSLTFDHRIVTGGQAARFLEAILEFLNN